MKNKLKTGLAYVGAYVLLHRAILITQTAVKQYAAEKEKIKEAEARKARKQKIVNETIKEHPEFMN